MNADLLDLLLVVAALLFAASGYRQGFVVGVLSFVGFLGGGVVGAKIAPSLAGVGPLGNLPEAVVGLVIVFLAASIGQVFATLLGGALRRRLTARPARQVDAIGGAATTRVGLLLVSRLAGPAVAYAPVPTAASPVTPPFVPRPAGRRLRRREPAAARPPPRGDSHAWRAWGRGAKRWECGARKSGMSLGQTRLSGGMARNGPSVSTSWSHARCRSVALVFRPTAFLGRAISWSILLRHHG